MSVIHFTTRSKDVFPYWTKAPEIGLRRIMTLIALAPKTGLTGSKTPVVRDRNGRVIDGLVVDSSDAKEFVERLTKYDFSTDWSFQISIGRKKCTISAKQIYSSESWSGAVPRTAEIDAALQNVRNKKNREMLEKYGEFCTDYSLMVDLKFDDKSFNNFLGAFLDLLTPDETNIQMIVTKEFCDIDLIRKVEDAVKIVTKTEDQSQKSKLVMRNFLQ